MPRKIDLITGLYQRTIKKITADSVAWRAFLHSAAYQYKYPFADQVLIFAQRPKAIACAGMELWNTHFGRWIKRGATGIALIDKQGSSDRLHYVFDVSDTRTKGEWPDERPFELWWVKPEYHADVIEALQNRFMDDDKLRSKLSDAVLDATITLCTDNMTDYLQELSNEKEGSFLEELDDENLRVRFFVTLQAGVAYTVLTRLGFHADDFVPTDSFEWVHEFNSPATVNILGSATSAISEICLREIERTVRGVERSIRETNRTFDGQPEIEYNDSERETSPNRNGGTDHGNHLQDRERDPNPESGDAQADELPHREVWSDEIDFHVGTQEGNLHDHSDRGTAESVSARDRRDGQGADRVEYIPDGTEPWGIGEIEGRESDAVGADDEQHQSIGGGGSAGEPNLSVIQSNQSIKDEALPQISDPQNLIQILRHGDFLRHSKQEIVSFLTSDKSETEKVAYVKASYSTLLFAEFYKQGTEEHLGYRAAEDGLLLYEGNFMTRKAETLMDWPFVTELIGALIKDGNYLDEPQADKQMTLFDAEQGPEPAQEPPKPDTVAQMRIPQEVIDEFLRLGGCIRKSAQRIYGFYRRANNQAENVAFLRDEYQTDSVGIVVSDKSYAVKWDEDGVRISTGDRVSEVSSILLPWEYIDKRIRELLESGQYLPQNEAEKANEIWETYVADKVAFLYREDYENIPKEYKTTSSFLWPEINNFYREILRDTENLPSFIKEMQANEERVKEYPGRFRRFYDGKKIAGLVSTFLRDPVEFPQADPNILPPKQFVTQDKIDAYLTERGTPFSDGKLAIYSFFLRNKDTKERASFLAKSYGIGGSGGGRIDTNHDGKGLALYGGLQRWKDGVLLKWPQVAKRIEELIKQGKYLNDREKQELDRYERKIVSERIRVFYSRKGKDFLLPYADHGITGYWEDVADLQEQIQSKERLGEIVEGMQTVFESLIPGGDEYARENYERDKQALEDVKGYLTGKFNIFPNSPYRKKTPFAPDRIISEPEPVAAESVPLDEEMPDTEYDLKLGATVYIGKDEMEILSLAGGKVELFDGTLIPLELDFATFLKRLRENRLNDGLKKQEKTIEAPVELVEDAVARANPQGNDIWGKYEQMKQQYPHHIVMVRVGDFYELFEDDAVEASDTLGLTLTGREVEGKPTRVPMCGISAHKESDYVQKLLDKGYKVAIDGGEELTRDIPPEAIIVTDGDGRTAGEIQADRAEEAELTAVSRFLHATRMEDIDLSFDMGEIVARDSDNEWRGKDFYEFLLNDAIALDENHNPVEGMSIPDEILKPILELAEKYGANIESVSRHEPDELDRAKDYIREYLVREFDEQEDHFDDLSKIELAFTTVSDENIPVQTEVDLEKYQLRMYLRDVLVETIQYESLRDMNDNLLCGLDFGGLTEVTEEQIEAYHRETTPVIPPPMEPPKPRKTLPVYNSHPEIPNSEKHNYCVTDNEIGTGGPKAKFRKNIEAIRLLYALEAENRLATPEEQDVLAQYSGWGGLADAFDATKDNWHFEYNELKNLLTPEEYEAANESTLTAFYTPPVVIKAMYKALENMGFKRGNILEPSCGVGNFMGLLPDSMDAKMYGVELDSLSGRIARQLYQKNGITIDGYERTQFPDSIFDVAVGNVPFNDFKLVDKRYDKYNFLIHDYFFAKTLDKVRPGGVVAFITSSGTLDKENPSVRKYISQRADFLGAIRLPNNTFDGAGANKVVSDIIFLQKRDRIVERDEDWVHLGTDENGIRMNQYFVDHPDMVLGEMAMRSGPYGPEPTCEAYEDEDLDELLNEAVSNIHAEISEVELGELAEGTEDKSIPADPTVKNFSFTLVDGKVYYRQNSVMNPVETSVTGENRIKGMIGIRDMVRALIDAQLEDYPESEIKELQSKLNRQYDAFTAKYGLINSRGNAMVFSDDDSYFLLCSLEILDENKELKAKADMFTKRTIKPQVKVDRVDTASEALALSIGERAMIDMEYMSELTGKDEAELFADLKGVIFRNPEHGNVIGAKPYLMADEYLAGNVREKLKQAREKAEADPQFAANVEALERVQPIDLTAAEIGVRLGTTWIPEADIQAFVYELLGTSFYARRHIQVKYIPQTAQWVISNKTKDIGNVKADNAYGTHRINAYEIIEQTLNLKDVRIFDYVYDANGNKQAILNKKETAIAQGKQEQIKRAFDEWIWKDPARRERLCRLYNERFNSLRPREFDGSHIRFYGMNPEITLRKHQCDAVARIMYGGNSLLAHVVGAGKTFTMVAAAQESKRLGLCNKSMFVVPNHLIEQWASEYLQLYPSANILVATKKDFETKNRKKFCARIATGDYDAVIIGHSQFEKIPMSLERQIQTLNNERDEILQSIEEVQSSRGDRVTVKQLAKAKKQIETKLKKLNDQSRKDDVVTFEELGVDRLFVDEAHFYKNLAAYTKMRNVAGISQTEAQKSSDLYMKCRYLDELTGGKGCIFATGTPISNTMVELYTMQRYLQYDELQMRGLLNFDSWASTFGETVTAIELAPDGSGYRAKTRFAKFFNIPELMAMFKQTADIQTADMLKLPVPEAHYHIVKVEASDVQKKLVESFAERAEKVHNRLVDSSQDNMLLITNDGRKAALDQRLINPVLGDYEGSKVNTCVQNIFDIWEQTADQKSAQLVFCDLSTPKGDGSFNVYDDIRSKLIEMGVPENEIEFIHNADSDTKKKELFAKVRRGQVRVLMGSTFKMGAGTNVQQRLKALHDLDVPWRPADLEQRAGRIVRQGNTNSEVDLYRYVTEGTFDAYSYQLLESKQKFISQVMTSKSPVRSAEDVDETALSYAEIKALASGNPKIMEKMQLDADVAKLKLMKADHLSQRYGLEDALIKHFPKAIAEQEERIRGITADIETALNFTVPNENGFSPMVIMGTTYTEKADAGKEILAICERMVNPESRPLGEYRGFQMDIGFDTTAKTFFITLRGSLHHVVQLWKDAHGIITRLDNAIGKFDSRRQTLVAELDELHKQVENAKAEVAKPFPDEAVLEEKSRRLAELNAELDMDRRENEIVDGAEEQSEEKRELEEKRSVKYDREDR